MESEPRGRNGRNDVLAVDEAVGGMTKTRIVAGHEIRPADARRSEHINLRLIEALLASGAVRRDQRDRSTKAVAGDEKRAAMPANAMIIAFPLFASTPRVLESGSVLLAGCCRMRMSSNFQSMAMRSILSGSRVS